MGPQSSPAYASVNSPASAHLAAKQISVWLSSLVFDRLGNASRPKLLFAVALRRRSVGCRRMASGQFLHWFTLSAVMVRRGRGGLSRGTDHRAVAWTMVILDPFVTPTGAAISQSPDDGRSRLIGRGGPRLHVRSAHCVAGSNLGMDGIQRHSAVQRPLYCDARHRPADTGRSACAADRHCRRRQGCQRLDTRAKRRPCEPHEDTRCVR